MGYQVLARKWRPRNFKEMVGQEHVVRALLNGLTQNRLHHAYLFTGTRGVGKTTLARILAKSFNCADGVTAQPCGQCDACVAVQEGRFVDLIEVDAASRTKVEDTRELLENVVFSPAMGRYKVYLIDEVHMLSTHSFNALLKTLEEPPEHVKFLLATTDPKKLPVTVLSRCLQFNLKRLSTEQIATQLAFVLQQEQMPFQAAALKRLSLAADGSMRDALSLLDQAIAYGAGKVDEQDVCTMLGAIDQHTITDLLAALLAEDAQRIMTTVCELAQMSADFDGVLRELLICLHHLAVLQMVPDIEDPRFDQIGIRDYATRFRPEDVQLYYQIGLLGRQDLTLSPDPRVGFEMVMLRMLAFRPVESPREQQAIPAVTTAPTAAKRASEATLPPPPPIPTAPRTTPAPPITTAPPVTTPSPVASTPPSGNIEALTKDWHAVVKHLRLKALAKELADNCAFDRWSDGTLHLSLEPSRAHLLTKLLQSRLQEALAHYLERAVVLKIHVQTVQQETPAQSKHRESEQRQASAVQSIEGDPHVQAMKEVFGAQIVPESIQPIDEKK